jgi:uncharacterized CHY-type Zn-finger protein
MFIYKKIANVNINTRFWHFHMVFYLLSIHWRHIDYVYDPYRFFLAFVAHPTKTRKKSVWIRNTTMCLFCIAFVARLLDYWSTHSNCSKRRWCESVNSFHRSHGGWLHTAISYHVSPTLSGYLLSSGGLCIVYVHGHSWKLCRSQAVPVDPLCQRVDWKGTVKRLCNASELAFTRCQLLENCRHASIGNELAYLVPGTNSRTWSIMYCVSQDVIPEVWDAMPVDRRIGGWLNLHRCHF